MADWLIAMFPSEELFRASQTTNYITCIATTVPPHPSMFLINEWQGFPFVTLQTFSFLAFRLWQQGAHLSAVSNHSVYCYDPLQVIASIPPHPLTSFKELY